MLNSSTCVTFTRRGPNDPRVASTLTFGQVINSHVHRAYTSCCRTPSVIGVKQSQSCVALLVATCRRVQMSHVRQQGTVLTRHDRCPTKVVPSQPRGPCPVLHHAACRPFQCYCKQRLPAKQPVGWDGGKHLHTSTAPAFKPCPVSPHSIHWVRPIAPTQALSSLQHHGPG